MVTGIKESCKIDEQIENGGCAVTTEDAEAILRNMSSGNFSVCPGIKKKSKNIDRPVTKEECKIDRIHPWERECYYQDFWFYSGCRQLLVISTYQEQEPEISNTKHEIMQEKFEMLKERLERKRRSLDRLSYDGCSRLLVRPTYQEQEPEISNTKHEILPGMLKGPIPRIMEDDWPHMLTHSGWFNPPRRTTYKEHEQDKEDNFKRIQECKEKIVNVNGPEIQQTNHDGIDKEQQPGQDFIDETAKGVKMELLFSYLKYSLILILVGFPVADCNHQDFKWLPTNTIVKGVFQTDVQLVWKYQYNLMLDKIDISRKKTEYEKEDVAMWTPDEGSKPNTLLSTDVSLKHWKERGVGTIILTLVDPYPVDFDKQYYCTVYFENGLDSMEIALQSYKVEYQPVVDVVKARPGDDVQFVWIYKYPLPVTFVDFYKNDDIQKEILTWSRSDGVYDIDDEYKNRTTVTVTTNKDQEEVTLTLRNVTRGDFDHKYCSLAIPANGYYSVSKIRLRRLPVEEEKLKPVQETISTPSSASRLSQVSMFLICSVLLLAV